MFNSKRIVIDPGLVNPRTPTGLTPYQVAKAYNFPMDVDVSKRLVAILELGGSCNNEDVISYCDSHGFKHPILTEYFVDGAVEVSDPQGADGEVCLDIDVIAAVAQGVQIAVVYAPNTDQGFIDGFQRCIDLNPDAISISWGSAESSWSASTRKMLDQLFLNAIAAKINVFVAAGDNGSSDGGFGNNCDYPASSPYVIACGGTHLELNSDGTRQLETAWSLGKDGSGTGGGKSQYYLKPSYQSVVNLTSNRMEPDLSCNAAPSTGYIININGSKALVGGTSAVAPLLAALCAIINAHLGSSIGDWHPVLYSNSDMYYDVVQGTNGSYNCTKGFDMVTGMGVIDGTKLLTVLQGGTIEPVPPVNPTPNPPPKNLWQKLLSILGL